MTSADTYDDHATSLHDDLTGHPAILDTDVDTARRPYRVIADIDQLPIPAGVQDILTTHQATIEQVEGGTDGLLVTLRPTRVWRPAGQRTIRAHGGSIVCTLTREAVEASGLTEGVEVDLAARDDQVRITRRTGAE
jgi:hypothetical protein